MENMRTLRKSISAQKNRLQQALEEKQKKFQFSTSDKPRAKIFQHMAVIQKIRIAHEFPWILFHIFTSRLRRFRSP